MQKHYLVFTNFQLSQIVMLCIRSIVYRKLFELFFALVNLNEWKMNERRCLSQVRPLSQTVRAKMLQPGVVISIHRRQKHYFERKGRKVRYFALDLHVLIIIFGVTQKSRANATYDYCLKMVIRVNPLGKWFCA